MHFENHQTNIVGNSLEICDQVDYYYDYYTSNHDGNEYLPGCSRARCNDACFVQQIRKVSKAGIAHGRWPEGPTSLPERHTGAVRAGADTWRVCNRICRAGGGHGSSNYVKVALPGELPRLAVLRIYDRQVGRKHWEKVLVLHAQHRLGRFCCLAEGST
jgi:hypothetical protein